MADAEQHGGHLRHSEGQGEGGEGRARDQPRSEQGADGGGGGVHGRPAGPGPVRGVPDGAGGDEGEALQPRQVQRRATGGDERADQAARLHRGGERRGCDDDGLRQDHGLAAEHGAPVRRGVRERDHER